MVRYLSQLMASQANGQLFGETEFLMQDAVHRLGAVGIDIALHERNGVSMFASRKRGIKVGTSRAPTVATKRSS